MRVFCDLVGSQENYRLCYSSSGRLRLCVWKKAKRENRGQNHGLGPFLRVISKNSTGRNFVVNTSIFFPEYSYGLWKSRKTIEYIVVTPAGSGRGFQKNKKNENHALKQQLVDHFRRVISKNSTSYNFHINLPIFFPIIFMTYGNPGKIYSRLY